MLSVEYQSMTKNELETLRSQLQNEYDAFQALGLKSGSFFAPRLLRSLENCTIIGEMAFGACFTGDKMR